MKAATKAQELRRETYRGTHMRDTKGVYAWKDETFPSITTLLKVLDKPALPRWASKSVAEYVAEFVGKVKEKRMPWAEVQEHLSNVEMLKGIPWEYAEKKRDLGSTFHDIAEQVAAGVPINVSIFGEDVRPLVRAFMQFVETEQPEFLAMETAGFNREIGYACTLDTVMLLPKRGRTVVVDYKTSKDSYPEHSLQLSAQRFAEFVGLRDGTEIPMMETDGGMVLLIMPDEYRLVEWPTCRADLDDIKALTALYNRNQRRIKYEIVSKGQSEDN